MDEQCAQRYFIQIWIRVLLRPARPFRVKGMVVPLFESSQRKLSLGAPCLNCSSDSLMAPCSGDVSGYHRAICLPRRAKVVAKGCAESCRSSFLRNASSCDEIDGKTAQPMTAFVVFARYRCKSGTSMFLSSRSDRR